MKTLSNNGLMAARNFPVEPYDRIHKIIVENWSSHTLYEHHSGAWNSLAYRYQDAFEAGQRFSISISKFGASPSPEERRKQEQDLYSFFTNGLSAIESAFYAMFTIGAFISPSDFLMETEKERKRISPNYTFDVFKKAFPEDDLLEILKDFFNNQSYIELRDTRNVLAHRAAPGRRMFVGIGIDDAPPVEWKLKDVALDKNFIPQRQKELASLISTLIQGLEAFLTKKV